MDLLKAKIYLDKINREFGRMLKDPDNIPRIDVDITQSYIRELYDAFLTETAYAAQIPPVKQEIVKPSPKLVVPPPPVVVEVPAPPVVIAPPPRVVVAPPPVVVEVPPPPVVVVPPPPPAIVVPPPPPMVAEPEPVVPETYKYKHTHAAAGSEADVLFEFKEAKELSEKLSDTPISDLKRAIALNDRLMIQRELFGNDNAAFDEALSALNSASSFEGAKSFLLHDCIGKYDWLHKNRVETAKSFVRLVRRRYK